MSHLHFRFVLYKIAADYRNILFKLSRAIRELQWCFRGGQGMRSLWRSVDLDHQITLVSQTLTDYDGYLQHKHILIVTSGEEATNYMHSNYVMKCTCTFF